MNDFRYLNYHTEYSVHGTANKQMDSEACFYYVFNGKEYQNNYYKIIIYRGLNMIKKTYDNGCFLEKSELHHHISILKHIFDFTFNIEECVNKNLDPYYELSLHISGANLIHRFILTWIRYVYEFPYNLYILDVNNMKTIDTFKYVNPINLFNIVASSYSEGNTGHMLVSPYRAAKLMKYNSLKNRICELIANNEDSLNDVFETIDCPKVKRRDITTLQDWKLFFKERLEIYNKFYNLIKKVR